MSQSPKLTPYYQLICSDSGLQNILSLPGCVADPSRAFVQVTFGSWSCYFKNRWGLPDDICIFKPKIPIWVNFGGSCNWRCWYILCTFGLLRPFDIFYDHLVHFVVIWYIFLRLGMLYQEKSGNPGLLENLSQQNIQCVPTLTARSKQCCLTFFLWPSCLLYLLITQFLFITTT
jgi:hypothetical protein